jgi:hypothetical protein
MKPEFNIINQEINSKSLSALSEYGRGYQAGYSDGLAKRLGAFSEDKMLTNSDLGGDLTLIYDYNRKKRALEADFSERAQRLDAEFSGKVGKCAGAELETKIQEKLKAHQNLNYMEAFEQVQVEFPTLTKQYIKEIHG